MHTLDTCSVAASFAFRGQPVRRAISAGPFRQSGHSHLGRMVMSGNTILAPREDSDSAIDREARGAAGGGGDRYRAWGGGPRGSGPPLGGLVVPHLAPAVGVFMPGPSLPPLRSDPPTRSI